MNSVSVNPTTPMDQNTSMLVRAATQQRGIPDALQREEATDQTKRDAISSHEPISARDPDPSKQTTDKQQSPEDVNQLVEQMNEMARMLNKHYEFSVDEETDQLVVKVTDARSGEVLYQIPPEELLKLTARLGKMMGMFLDEVA